AWTDSEVVRLLAISFPPASPLSPWSSPSPWIPFPPLPPILSPPLPVGESSSAAAAARPAGGLRADYGFFATMDREIMCDPERERGYGITDSWDEIVETLQGAPVTWVRATDVSDLVHGKVMSLRTTVLGQMSEIRELQAADRRRQTVIS
nr:hypothetical protein [Tanacetum cinerariifolium]